MRASIASKRPNTQQERCVVSDPKSVLREPAQQVDPRCRTWWAAQLAITTAIGVGALALLGALISPVRTILWIIGGVALLLGVIAIVVVPGHVFRIHRWEVNEIGVYSRRGWLWQEWRAVPFARLQTVDVTSGPLQRSFGLATVTATTASAKGPVLIEAIDQGQAADLARDLAARAQGESAEDGT